MNLFSFLVKLFGPETTEKSEADQRWLRGYKAIESGKIHFLNRRAQEALECFDVAIECESEGDDVYEMRGSCLQSLEWHLDAIDDFTTAISRRPDDSNLFFQRAMSMTAIGDGNGFEADINEAIRLSKLDTALSRSHNEGAIEMGWSNVTKVYENQARAHQAKMRVQASMQVLMLGSSSGLQDEQSAKLRRRRPHKAYTI